MKIQKSIDFVSSNKNQLEMEIGRNVSFTRVTKTLKIFRNKYNMEGQDLYEEH